VNEKEEASQRLKGEIRKTDGALVIKTDLENLLETAQKLKEEGYDHVISLTAIDYPKDKKMILVMHVEGFEVPEEQPRVVELQVELDRDNPKVPTLTNIWPSTEFQEREAFEMFGIIFEGHPDLRHLLLSPEEFKELRPLRKDFVVKEEDIMLKENWGDYRG